VSPRKPETQSARRAPRRPPGRPRAAESVDEQAFLDTALKAFAAQGYDAVSVRKLNRRLGVSHSWVHQRFGSKLGLWYAAVDHAFGEQATTIAFDPTINDPLDQLERVVRRFLRYTAEHPELGRIVNAEGAEDTERLAYLYQHYIDPPRASLERLLTHLIAEGRIRPVKMRTLFLLIAHGAAAPFELAPLARHLAESESASAEDVDEHIDAATRIIIDGLRIYE
jgi:TetR/AcrR family transcriptional regulator